MADIATLAKMHFSGVQPLTVQIMRGTGF